MKQNIIRYGTLLFCIVAIIVITIRYEPVDYLIYLDNTKAWLSGNTLLYTADFTRFIYSPWTLFLFVPFTLLPPIIGMLVYNLISVLLLFWIAKHFIKDAPWWAYTIALFNFYLIMYIQFGQFDLLILFSLILAAIAINQHRPWILGNALVVVTMKPTNVILPLLIITLYLCRWSIIDIIRTIALPLLAFVSSFLLVGGNWLLRYLILIKTTSQFLNEIPIITIFGITTYKTSYWDYFNIIGKFFLGIFLLIAVAILFRCILRTKFSELKEEHLYFSLAINLAASPHFILYHLVYLAPIFTQFLTEYPYIGYLLILTSIIDLVLCYLGVGFSIFIPIIIVVLSLYHTNLLRKVRFTHTFIHQIS